MGWAEASADEDTYATLRTTGLFSCSHRKEVFPCTFSPIYYRHFYHNQRVTKIINWARVSLAKRLIAGLTSKNIQASICATLKKCLRNICLCVTRYRTAECCFCWFCSILLDFQTYWLYMETIISIGIIVNETWQEENSPGPPDAQHSSTLQINQKLNSTEQSWSLTLKAYRS